MKKYSCYVVLLLFPFVGNADQTLLPSEAELGGKVENLDATEDREAGEESHCASNHTQLGNQGHLIRDVIK